MYSQRRRRLPSTCGYGNALSKCSFDLHIIIICLVAAIKRLRFLPPASASHNLHRILCYLRSWSSPSFLPTIFPSNMFLKKLYIFLFAAKKFCLLHPQSLPKDLFVHFRPFQYLLVARLYNHIFTAFNRFSFTLFNNVRIHIQ